MARGTIWFLKKALWAVYNLSLREIVERLASRPRVHAGSHDQFQRTVSDLRRRFRRFQTKDLKATSAEAFAEHVQAEIGAVDAESEGYSVEELGKQRDLTIKFHWGHDHDFGDFQLRGRMGERHLHLLANFSGLFSVSLREFDGLDVLDIGCWTGGTALALASLGARVVAVEEVKKYAAMSEYLVRSFGLEDRVTIEAKSVYDCICERYHDRFDVVHFPGVVYHLSDPLIALRILFNASKIGGIILVESAGMPREEPFCRFEGSSLTRDGDRRQLSRGGWNWFVPTPSALYRMMREAGFEEVKTLWHQESGRVYGYGKKTEQVAICRAGLSVRSIR